MANPEYPQTRPTATNAPLLDGWKRGELMLQHCADCRAIIFFPREVCPQCWSTRLEWKRASGRGRIVSFAHVYKHVTPPFAAEAPTVLAEIAFQDGGAMMARVVTNTSTAIAAGTEVELVPPAEAAKYPLPTFKPVA